MKLDTGAQQRRVRFVQVVGLVVVASLVQGCSDDAGSGSSERDDGKEASTTESTEVAEAVQEAPGGIAEFVARSTRPDGCPDLTEAPEQISDPRAKWLISSRTVQAVDGFVSGGETVWIVTASSEADGTVGSVLHSDGGGPTSVALDRPLVSVTRGDGGRLYGLSLGEDGTKIVSIGEGGITTPVVELPEMPLAGSLLVDGGSFYLLDLRGFVEVEGPGPEQGVPVLARVTPDGAVEHFGVASSGAYAGLVDGVSLTSGTGDGVEVENASGDEVARAAFPGRYVGEQTWMIPNYSLSEAVVVGDRQVQGCAIRYGTTELGVYHSLFGTGD